MRLSQANYILNEMKYLILYFGISGDKCDTSKGKVSTYLNLAEMEDSISYYRNSIKVIRRDTNECKKNKCIQFRIGKNL